MRVYYVSTGSGSGSITSFSMIQGDAGTTIVADSATDTLTVTGDGVITTSGNGTTDTLSILLGTVPINKGGTGQVTANAALNALLPSQTGNANKVLGTNGTNTSWVIASALDLVSYSQYGGF